jgi:hypothetical protein
MSIDISLTNDQYKLLMEALFYALIIADASMDDEKSSQYIDLETYLLRFYKQLGFSDYVDENDGESFVNTLFHEEIAPLFKAYDDDMFWNVLSLRLAEQDIAKTVDEETLQSWGEDHFFEERAKRVTFFMKEFSENGMQSLVFSKPITLSS